MLNQEQFEKKWVEIKSGFRNVWGLISEEELENNKSDLTNLFPLIQARYQETLEEIKMKYDQLLESFDNNTDKGLSPDITSFERRPPGSEDYIQDFDSDRNARH